MDNRTLKLQRTIKASRKLVWEAWTQSEHIVNWWGPGGMKTEVETLDFRIGGQWKYILVTPDERRFQAYGTFSDIIKFEKIVSLAHFEPVTEGVTITALFEDEEDHTRLTFTVTHPSEEYCKQQEELGVMNGWGANFDRLEEYVTKVETS